MTATINTAYKHTLSNGFSLVELSIVLVIVGVLASAAVAPLSGSIRQARFKQTQIQLETIREALHGYLISSGRLPCPLDASSELLPSNDQCSTSHGALPGAILGVMGQRSATGALLDPWGKEYVYAVSMNDHESSGTQSRPDWLTVGEPVAVGASQLGADLSLCRKQSSGNCPAKDLIASDIVWVVFSKGESDGSTGAELENQDSDTVFAVSAYSSNKEQPFNDQFAWASRSELIYWLLKAEWLP